MDIFFSIVIPSYNRANRLPKAIDSVLSQTYPNFELIIVDDGSTDNTKEIVNSYNDSRIVYIYQENAERSAARNNGINHAKGEFICFLDSDDYYLDNHLEELKKCIDQNKNDVAMYATGTIGYNERTGFGYGRNIKMSKNLHAVHLIWNFFLFPDSVCIHKDILSRYQFDPRFSLWEDTYLFLIIAALYPFYQIERYTTVQVIHDSGTVMQNSAHIKIETVNKYLSTIEDLFINHGDILSPYLTTKDKNEYLVREINSFIGSAYKNRQYQVTLKLLNMKYQISKDRKRYIIDMVRFFIIFLKR